MTTRIPTHVRRVALAAFLAASALALPAPAAEFGHWPNYLPQRTDSKFGRAITRIMNPVTLRGRVHEEVVAELVALGPDAAPTLFAYLSGTIEGPEPDYSAPAEEPPPATRADAHSLPREDVILLDVLSRLPAEKVVPQLAAAALHAGVDVKLVALRCLGEIGGASAVDAWLDTLTSLEPVQLERAFVQSPSESALTAILRRDPVALTVLSARVKAAEARLLPAIVRAVGATRSARGIDVLIALLGRDPELDRVVVAQTAHLAEETVGTLTDEQLNWIRPFAADEDWLVRREALAALGRLGDFRSYATLIGALGDPQRLVAQTANWSLRRMTRQDHGYDADAWRGWFEQELAWFEDDGARWTRVLEDTDPARILEAVTNLTQHPLFRHEVCTSFLPLLQSSSRDVVLSMIEVLGNLGSRAAVSSLVNVLARDDEGLRNAAWAALVKLTGEKLPKDANAWSGYVSG